MALDFILYIITIMIFYDFSLHIVDLLRSYKKIKRRMHPLPIGTLFDYISKGNIEKRQQIRQIFWNIYWGIAFILMLIYFIF